MWTWSAASGVPLSSPLLQAATDPHGHHLRVAVVVLHDEGMILKTQTNKNNQYFIGGFYAFICSSCVIRRVTFRMEKKAETTLKRA